ncbi:MAG: hypothetical protein C0618_11925 [Desulfuromonas sp.]|nr:MAG: hypothetical protein C0618_11925 [Desulfuromonas sp.]
MKKSRQLLSAAIATLILAFPIASLANNTGCGLGTVLWEGKSDDSLVFQVLQGTTNNIFGNQTFGITSGTLGCDQPSNIIVNDGALAFTADNMDLIARDIASGEGESLDTLAELLNIPSQNRAETYATLQVNFNTIFISGEETAGEVLDRISILIL